MAHDERMLSQDEIDSLLKKIMPPTDKTAAKVEPASAKPVESTAKPEEKPADAMPGASFKTTVSPLSKETESPSQVESIKFNEYKPKKADTNPSVRPVEVVKREQPAGENAGLQKTVDDLSRQVEKLNAAMQIIAQLEEKVRQLESIIKIMPDSNRTLRSRIDQISAALSTLQQKQPDQTFLEGFTCSHCRAEGLVALYVKCTSCGKENWMGWWPDKNGR